MNHEEAFLEAVRKAPNDDGPRLLYADWLDERGDPRGEFIRVQCARERLAPAGIDAGRFAARAWRLLNANWRTWTDPLHALVGPDPSRRGEGWLAARQPDALDQFRRGFVHDFTFDAATFAAASPDTVRVLALRRGRVYGAGRGAAALAASPRLAPLETLVFADLYDAPLDAAGAAALAGSPHLTRLKTLILDRNNVADDGARALARAPWLLGLRLLDLTENGLSDDGCRALIESPYLPRGCTVRLSRNGVRADALDALARAHGHSRSQFLL
jgi:uncharacterized protein (TIGR02996 family)